MGSEGVKVVTLQDLAGSQVVKAVTCTVTRGLLVVKGLKWSHNKGVAGSQDYKLPQCNDHLMKVANLDPRPHAAFCLWFTA